MFYYLVRSACTLCMFIHIHVNFNVQTVIMKALMWACIFEVNIVQYMHVVHVHVCMCNCHVQMHVCTCTCIYIVWFVGIGLLSFLSLLSMISWLVSAVHTLFHIHVHLQCMFSELEDYMKTPLRLQVLNAKFTSYQVEMKCFT